MKYGDYSKLVHSNPKHKDWFVVNWCLGNTCNFSCSYCPEGLHNGSLAWPKVEDVKSFITKVIEQIAPKKVYFEFTGGEVTLMKNFIDICKHATSLGAKIGIISNGSRTIRWWEENKQYFDHVCLSYHPESADKDHFYKVVETVRYYMRTHVNIMMLPEQFEECFEFAEKIKDLGDISLALQPLIHDFGTELYDYTPVQTAAIDKQWDMIIKHIKYTKSFPYYRGAMRLIDEEESAIETKPSVSGQRLINDGRNSWENWKCYAGVEQIIVDMDGGIYRGWCKVGDRIGHISDENFQVTKDPVICNKNFCHCNFDIMCTKEKV